MPANQAQQYDVIGARGILSMLFLALEQTDGMSWISKLANRFTSNQDTETYVGLGNVPAMREWVGPKQQKMLSEMFVKITNHDFEATLAIYNKDRRRDKTGQLNVRMGDLATRAISHDAKLLSALIDGGTSTAIAIPNGGNVTVACYDGQPLFSATHKIGNVTAANNIITANLATYAGVLGKSVGTGTPTNPSPAAVALAIQDATAALYGFKDDQGEPLNEFAREFIVMVPPSLSGAANQAIKGQYLALGFNNPVLTQIAPSLDDIKYTVVPNPRLTWTNQIAVFRTDGAYRPLILQTEVLNPSSSTETQFGAADGAQAGFGLQVKVLAEGSDFEFDNNAIKMSVEKSGFMGLGRFDAAVLAQFTQAPA